MTASQRTDVLLIGGGVAAASAARTLRESDYDGTITLITRELDAPYHRPPGSKELMRREQSLEDALVLPVEWYAEHGVDLRTRTSIMSLDPVARTAKLQTKDELAYDRAPARDRRDGPAAQRRRLGSARDPLPAVAAQLAGDPQGPRRGRWRRR